MHGLTLSCNLTKLTSAAAPVAAARAGAGCPRWTYLSSKRLHTHDVRAMCVVHGRHHPEPALLTGGNDTQLLAHSVGRFLKVSLPLTLALQLLSEIYVVPSLLAHAVGRFLKGSLHLLLYCKIWVSYVVSSLAHSGWRTQWAGELLHGCLIMCWRASLKACPKVMELRGVEQRHRQCLEKGHVGTLLRRAPPHYNVCKF
jgi:hypothetical protein